MGTGGRFLRRLRASVADKPTGFVWVEGRSVAGTGLPSSRAQLEWLAGNGVSSILTLTEDPLPGDWVKGLALKVAHIPMRDHEAPSVKSMEKGVAFLKDQVAAGNGTAVHCLAGEGRTGCVLAAYMIAAHGLGAEEALVTLRKIKPAFVERRQERSVYEFAEAHSRSAERGSDAGDTA